MSSAQDVRNLANALLGGEQKKTAGYLLVGPAVPEEFSKLEHVTPMIIYSDDETIFRDSKLVVWSFGNMYKLIGKEDNTYNHALLDMPLKVIREMNKKNNGQYVEPKDIFVGVRDMWFNMIYIYYNIEGLSQYLRVDEEALSELLAAEGYKDSDAVLKQFVCSAKSHKEIYRLKVIGYDSLPIHSAVAKLWNNGEVESILIKLVDFPFNGYVYYNQQDERCNVLEEGEQLNINIYNWLFDCFKRCNIKFDKSKVAALKVNQDEIELLFKSHRI